MRKNKDTQEDIKFQRETLKLFIGTITKMIQKVVKDELKRFEKHYTNEVLKPALDDLRADLEKKSVIQLSQLYLIINEREENIMNQEITVTEVFDAIGRLPEEERLCVLQFIGLPGLANVLNSEEEYKKVIDKMELYIETYKVASRAIKNIHDDVEKQLIMKQQK